MVLQDSGAEVIAVETHQPRSKLNGNGCGTRQDDKKGDEIVGDCPRHVTLGAIRQHSLFRVRQTHEHISWTNLVEATLILRENAPRDSPSHGILGKRRESPGVYVTGEVNAVDFGLSRLTVRNRGKLLAGESLVGTKPTVFIASDKPPLAEQRTTAFAYHSSASLSAPRETYQSPLCHRRRGRQQAPNKTQMRARTRQSPPSGQHLTSYSRSPFGGCKSRCASRQRWQAL